MTKEQYQAYLKTDHWREFSISIKKRRGRCERCGIGYMEAHKLYKESLNVHHKNYENVGHEKEEDVEVLCHWCHMSFHGVFDWKMFLASKAMPGIPPPSRQMCANCGIENGPRFWNADEAWDNYLCWECSH